MMLETNDDVKSRMAHACRHHQQSNHPSTDSVIIDECGMRVSTTSESASISRRVMTIDWVILVLDGNTELLPPALIREQINNKVPTIFLNASRHLPVIYARV
jgi:hypothetical protein